jgi:hypothetical protein
MSMNRYVKVPSLQSGPFNTTTLNRVDFELDPDQVYDFDNSFIELFTNVTAEESDSGRTDGVYKVLCVNKKETGAKMYNLSLVKNCHLRSSNHGYLEDIRDVNTLRATLKEYEDSSVDKESETYKEISNLTNNRNDLQSTPFRELHKEGDVLSRDVEAPIRIPLKHLFNLGVLREFDCRKLGRTRVHIELDDVLQVQAQTLEGVGGASACNDILGPDSNVVEIEPTDVLPELMNSKWWVGQIVKINATAAGTASPVTDHYAKITRIDYNPSTRKVKLVIDNPLPALAGSGDNYLTVTCEPVVATSAAFTIDYAELTTQVVSNPSPMNDKMTYTTWSVEQFNAGGLTTFQKLYQVEPEAMTCVAMFPDKVSSMNNLVSNYRYRVDGVDQTNRNITPHSPLYYAMLNQTMLDADIPLNNLTEWVLDVDAPTQAAKREPAYRLLTLWSKLNMTQREKNVQLNINATGAGVNEINLYKLVLKSV